MYAVGRSVPLPPPRLPFVVMTPVTRRALRFVLASVAALPTSWSRVAGAQVVGHATTVEHSTAYTTATLRVRADSSLAAAVVAYLPRGRAVTVGSCGSEWCAVQAGTVRGYAVERYLATRPGSQRRLNTVPAGTGVSEGRGYTNSAGEHIRSPTRTTDGLAPAGASAQCRDGTYSFSRSRRGTCSHHGGVARWL
jgi:uncharacterized protein YraI